MTTVTHVAEVGQAQRAPTPAAPTPTGATPSERQQPTSFDLAAAWKLHPMVAVRPEPFGALLYHFGTRKLSFLKSQAVLAVVTSLASHPDARTALTAAGITDFTQYVRALATLADSKMIVRS
jgi:putative mycofactocin binding protein MftB